jgi:hypothetical protein
VPFHQGAGLALGQGCFQNDQAAPLPTTIKSNSCIHFLLKLNLVYQPAARLPQVQDPGQIKEPVHRHVDLPRS